MATAIPFKVQSGDSIMAVTAMGQGAPVLLVHGYTASALAWFFNMEPLARKFYVLAMDLPGHGQSTKRIAADPIPDFVQWLVRLLDYQGHRSVHIVGSSMGGAIALHMAIAHPERVRKVVLANPAGIGATPNPDLRLPLTSARTRDEIRAVMERILFDPAQVRPQAVEFSFAYRSEPGVPALIQELAPYVEKADYRPRLREVRAPTLVIWGQQDRLLLNPDLDALRGLPNFRAHRIDRCGHLPMVEHPEEFNSVVTDFLQQP